MDLKLTAPIFSIRRKTTPVTALNSLCSGSVRCRLKQDLEVDIGWGDGVAQLVERRPQDPMDFMTRGSNPVRNTRTKY